MLERDVYVIDAIEYRVHAGVVEELVALPSASSAPSIALPGQIDASKEFPALPGRSC
jgi:hypothetical protein